MKLSNAKDLAAKQHWVEAQVRCNPNNVDQWYILISGVDGKTHMLVGDDDDPIVTSEISTLIPVLKSLGIKSMQVIF